MQNNKRTKRKIRHTASAVESLEQTATTNLQINSGTSSSSTKDHDNSELEQNMDSRELIERRLKKIKTNPINSNLSQSSRTETRAGSSSASRSAALSKPRGHLSSNRGDSDQKEVFYQLVQKNGDFIGSTSKLFASSDKDLINILLKVKKIEFIAEPVSRHCVYGSSGYVNDLVELLNGPQLDRGMKVPKFLNEGIGIDNDHPLIIQVPVSASSSTVVATLSNSGSNANTRNRSFQSLITEFVNKIFVLEEAAAIMDQIWGFEIDTELVYEPIPLTVDCDTSNLKDRGKSLERAYCLLTLHIALREYAHKNNKSENDRLFNPLLALQGAPGTGKSAFLDLITQSDAYMNLEFESLDWDDIILAYLGATAVRTKTVNLNLFARRRLKESFNIMKTLLGKMLFLAVTFNSGCEFSAVTETNIGIACYLRVLYSYFMSIAGFRNRIQFELWRDVFVTANTVISINMITKFIRYYHASRITKTLKESSEQVERLSNFISDIPVTLLVDEIIKLKGSNVNNSLQNGVASFTLALGDQHVYLLMSTLNMSELFRTQTPKSGRIIYSIPLPLLKYTSALKLFHHWQRESYQFQFGIAACAGHPRTIQHFLRFLNYSFVAPKDFDVKCFVDSSSYNQTKLLTLTESMVKAALLGVRCIGNKPIDGTKFVDLVETGHFINTSLKSDDAVVPTVAPWQLLRYCSRTELECLNNLLNVAAKNNCKFDFRDFELFHSHWEVVARWAGRLTRLKSDMGDSVPLLGFYFVNNNATLKVKMVTLNEDPNESSGSNQTSNIASNEPKSNILNKTIDISRTRAKSKYKVRTTKEIASWQTLGPRVVVDTKKKGVIITSKRQFGEDAIIYNEKEEPLTLKDLEENIIVAGKPNNAGGDAYIVEKNEKGEYILQVLEMKLSDPNTLNKQKIGPTILLDKMDNVIHHLQSHFVGGRLHGQSLLGELNLTEDRVFLFGIVMGAYNPSYVVEYKGSMKIFCLNRSTLLSAYSPSLAQLPSFLINAAKAPINYSKEELNSSIDITSDDFY